MNLYKQLLSVEQTVNLVTERPEDGLPNINSLSNPNDFNLSTCQLQPKSNPYKTNLLRVKFGVLNTLDSHGSRGVI